jgi:hypothetical protein
VRVTLSRRLTRGDIPLRGALLMPLCVLGVHQLRFYLVFGSRAPAVLAREGHGYFQIAVPAVLLLAALAVGWFAGCVALAGAGAGAGSSAGAAAGAGAAAAVDRRGRSHAPRGVLRTWLVCALLLFLMYCGQELVEGLVAPGHPAGIAGVLGQGGWTAAPLSLLIGAALALTLRVAGRLLEAAQRRTPPLWTSATGETAGRRAPRTTDWRLDPEAGVTAGRAPPRAPVTALI